jgi:hypothetical protein
VKANESGGSAEDVRQDLRRLLAQKSEWAATG